MKSKQLLKHEPLREALDISFDGTVESLGFDAVQLREVFVQHHPPAAHLVNLVLYDWQFHKNPFINRPQPLSGESSPWRSVCRRGPPCRC